MATTIRRPTRPFAAVVVACASFFVLCAWTGTNRHVASAWTLTNTNNNRPWTGAGDIGRARRPRPPSIPTIVQGRVDAVLTSATVAVASASSAVEGLSSSASPIMAAFEADALGRDLQSRGALNAAVEAFSRAANLHPSPERFLRLGIALEENGLPYEAVEAYETARTTSSDPVLRHDVALKLAHVWADDLGDAEGGGLRYADAALDEEGYGGSKAAWDRKAVFLAAGGRIDEALELWDAVLGDGGGSDVDPSTGLVKRQGDEEFYGGGIDDARFFRGVARALTGRTQEAEADFALLPPSMNYMIDSWRYIQSHPPQQPHNGWDRLFSGTCTFLHDALSAAPPCGLIAEFGVFHGKSIRLLAAMVGPTVPLDGFDTFEGIPEDWGDEEAGSYTAAAEIPPAPDNVRFHVGLFADTLPGYVASLPPAEEQPPVRLINVDCDLYQGTVEILQYLSPRIGPGTVLVFDEYLMHPTWPDDEYRAFQEAVVKYGWTYEYLTFSLVSKQAVVRITSSDSFVGQPAEKEARAPSGGAATIADEGVRSAASGSSGGGTWTGPSYHWQEPIAASAPSWNGQSSYLNDL